ncbi:2TM domain-containing protein [Methanobrevibacter sp. TMH8]|uniref:2TM domain-containing protein n=1 Tax=Methanobrevibacter sp. TMH8 TaxID=2848611 RepID=UPI001CCCC097|nr:2TM domain-containing protein [Methanobrevibacter sp. TMH8]MBZ9570815.1 2TM domain-containing protein [Methanobrevibacter sp. TMH8]
MHDTNDESYKRAKKRLEDVKGFYTNLISYIIVNIFLFIINMIFTPGFWWFLFPLVFWGIGVVFHFLGVFVFEKRVFGKKWEDKKIQQYMEDEKK